MTARTRALFAALLVLICVRVTLAQSWTYSAPSWDLADPLNVAEKAQFTNLWVQGLDNGNVPATLQCFSFSNAIPLRPQDLYLHEIALFSDIYASQISTGYSIWDLIRDEQKVRHRFRDYVLTGDLKTSLTGDEADATVKHFFAITDALFAGTKYEPIDGYDIVDGKLISHGLKIKIEVVPPGPLPEPIPDGQFTCAHKWLIECLPEQLLIDCMKQHGLYFIDGHDWPIVYPDFNCDDFCWMTMNWLRRTLLNIYPDADVSMIGIGWECGNKYEGHAILKVEYDGMIWFFDPTTNTMMGPYAAPLTQAQILAIIRALIGPLYNCNDGSEPGPIFIPLHDRPEPWHWWNPAPNIAPPPFDYPVTTPDVFPTSPWCDQPEFGGQDAPTKAWRHFKEILELCCQGMVHPEPFPNPSGTPPCPDIPCCIPWPDMCDPEKYTYPIIP